VKGRRIALLAAITAAALSAAALLAADIAGVAARELIPLLLPLGVLWGLISIAGIIDARLRDRDRDGWVPEKYRDDEHGGL
jgi:hypothetical protein